MSRYAADVFFAGGADNERRPFLAALVANGFDVALYGDYWERFAETRPVTRGHGSPKELRHAIAASKVCLGLVRRANRDGHAMRSIEVPAAGGCFLVERTREHEDIFGPDGEAVTYFDDIEGMVRETAATDRGRTLARATPSASARRHRSVGTLPLPGPLANARGEPNQGLPMARAPSLSSGLPFVEAPVIDVSMRDWLIVLASPRRGRFVRAWTSSATCRSRLHVRLLVHDAVLDGAADVPPALVRHAEPRVDRDRAPRSGVRHDGVRDRHGDRASDDQALDERPSAPPSSLAPIDSRLTNLLLVTGAVLYLVVFPLAGYLPSMTAFVSTGSMVAVVAMSLKCWSAWHGGRDRRCGDGSPRRRSCH